MLRAPNLLCLRQSFSVRSIAVASVPTHRSRLRTAPAPTAAPRILPPTPARITPTLAISPAPLPPPTLPIPTVPFRTLRFFPPPFFLTVLLHVADEAHGHRFDVHKVAEAATAAGVLVEVTASGLAEVGDGAELYFHLSATKVSTVHDVERVGGFFFVGELGVHVTNHVVAQVVTDMEGFETAKLGELFEKILKENQEIFACLGFVDFYVVYAPTFRRSIQLSLSYRVAVDVLDENGGRKRRKMMEARASSTVTAGTYFEVKGTIHLVFLRSVNPG